MRGMCVTNQAGVPTRWGLRTVLLTAAGLWLLLCSPPAVAQSNSLFGGRQHARARQVPTTQPAGGQPVDVATAMSGPRAALGIRTAARERLVQPRSNALLLQVSPIAVAMPEPEVIGVNDQVTIIIRESKTATSDSKMNSKKDWGHEWELSNWIRMSDLHGIVPAIFAEGNPAVKFDYKNDYSGDGKYDRKDELTTRIQATVIDVKPNGTLVLEATKGITIDDEGYRITLTGNCRSDDVTPQNTILSTQIAALEIDVKHNGAIRDATRRGWLMRAHDFLRPF